MKNRIFLFGIFAFGILSVVPGVHAQSQKSETEEITKNAVSLQNAFVHVAATVKPSIVQITTETMLEYRYWNPFGNNEDQSGNPFEHFVPKTPEGKKPRTFKKQQRGLGSGFIIDSKGYILTNNHVIDGVDKILVKLFHDDHKYEAEIIGTDSKTDIALIKINVKKELPVVVFGDSDNIRVGEWVMAIGNPMGLSETVTVGVISAKGRSGFGITQYEDFIQTDAAINPGNSGGPLVNIQGQVIGINTFLIAPYAAQSIGFAIPINLAETVFSQLKDQGKVTRGFLGIVMQPLSEELAKLFGSEKLIGALVTEVVLDTPAAKAGIEPGDIILECDGSKIEDIRNLQMMVANLPVEKKVRILVLRDGKEITLSVKIGEMPESGTFANLTNNQAKWRGMKVSEITDDMKRNLQIGEDKGVIVIEVVPDSPAEEASIIPGMIIKSIGRHRIQSIDDYREVIQSISKNKSVAVLIRLKSINRWIELKGEK